MRRGVIRSEGSFTFSSPAALEWALAGDVDLDEACAAAANQVVLPEGPFKTRVARPAARERAVTLPVTNDPAVAGDGWRRVVDFSGTYDDGR